MFESSALGIEAAHAAGMPLIDRRLPNGLSPIRVTFRILFPAGARHRISRKDLLGTADTRDF